MNHGLRTKAVLVVDDFQNMRSTIKRMLQSIGVDDVDLSANGRDALGQMAKRRYDIVFCDYNLGEGPDGQQVLEEARHHRLIGVATLFVMITAENTKEMVMGAVECRPDDYLTKPFTKDLLKKRLERLLQKKQQFRAIEEAIDGKELQKAIALCDAAISVGPRNVNELLRVKAGLLIDVGSLEKAEAICQQVLAQRSMPWAHYALARIRYLGKNYPEASDILEGLLEEHGTHTESYDLLAECLLRQGMDKEAQEVLASAVRLSPRAIQRQEALGKLASKNEDYSTAESAFRRAVGLGHHSVHRSAEHYTRLAKVQLHSASGREAAKTLKRLRKDFSGDESAMLQAAITESDVHKESGNEELAKKSFADAVALYERIDEALPIEATIEMGKQFIAFGDKEKGLALIQDVVRNHHESEEVRAIAQAAFKNTDYEDEGNRLINDAHREVAKLNNKGVSLFQEGNIDESISLFTKAAEKLPGNCVVNLNAALVMLKKLKATGGGDAAPMGDIRRYLDRVEKIDPKNRTYLELRKAYDSIC